MTASKIKADVGENLKTPFSDSELEYFKNIILEKRKNSLMEIEGLKKRIMNDNHRDLDNDSEYSYHMADSASVSTDREHVYQMMDRLEKFLGYLDRAFDRIEDKTYGICRVTGKRIDKERLEVIPHTQLSIEGKLLEKQQGVSHSEPAELDLI